MKSDNRYVFDTNVIVSALLFEQSVPGQAFHQAIDRGEILLSHAIAEELNDVLSREKFNRYLHRDQREQFLQALVHEARLIEIDQHVRVCRDPRDDMFLELAVCGSASCLVSGDEDLLAMNPFRGISIVTARQFVDSPENRPEQAS